MHVAFSWNPKFTQAGFKSKSPLSVANGTMNTCRPEKKQDSISSLTPDGCSGLGHDPSSFLKTPLFFQGVLGLAQQPLPKKLGNINPAASSPVSPSVSPAPHIQKRSALSPNSVAKHFSEQAHPYTLKDIQSLLRTVQTQTQCPHPELILQTLFQMTAYAQFNSLNILAKELSKDFEKGYPLIEDNLPGSLGSVVFYLASKKNFATTPFFEPAPPEPEPITPTSVDANPSHPRMNPLFPPKTNRTLSQILTQKPCSPGNLLLDETVLHHLQRHPEWVEKIRKSPIQLVVTPGMMEGISPFNQGDEGEHLEHLAQKMKGIVMEVMKMMASVQNKSSIASYQAIETVLKNRCLDKLSHLHPSLREKIRFILPSQPSSKTLNPEEILKQLNPPFVSASEIQDILNQICPATLPQQAALEFLSRSGEVFSPRRVGKALVQIHQGVLDYATSHGISVENIVFINPNNQKSYCLMNHMYQALNHVSPSQFITLEHGHPDWMNLRKNTEDAPHLLVVLDDLAGTGASLNSALHEIDGAVCQENTHLYLAPIISTDAAFESYFTLKAQQKAQSRLELKYRPHRIIQPFHLTDYFNQLTLTEKSLFNAILQKRGHYQANTSVVFPWMGSDTNNDFWGRFFVSPHTLNGNGNKRPAHNWVPLSLEDLPENMCGIELPT
jgi:hypothetical protein